MHYDLEKAVFSAAEEALGTLRARENYNTTGVDALKAVITMRRPPIHIDRIMKNDPESSEYLERLGSFVELAASLPKPVDQQR